MHRCPMFRSRLMSLGLVAALLGPVPILAPMQLPAGAALAQAEAGPADPAVLALSETLLMSATFAVMVEEGLDYGASIEEQMFPGQGGARWAAMVATIYDPTRLRATFDAAFQQALAGDAATIAAAQEFFGSDLGQRILTAEIAARRAILDEATEEAARVEAERMQAARDPRLRLIRDLAEAGDLIEMNVAGALTANLAFFQGMNDIGVPGMAMDREQLMTEVWSQEDSIRDETGKWLYPFLALAYRPLSDDDLQAYVAFSESPAGKRLNAALFSAFDQVFSAVSFQLGRGAAQVLQGDDI